jgi:hypothetical protein
MGSCFRKQFGADPRFFLRRSHTRDEARPGQRAAGPIEPRHCLSNISDRRQNDRLPRFQNGPDGVVTCFIGATARGKMESGGSSAARPIILIPKNTGQNAHQANKENEGAQPDFQNRANSGLCALVINGSAPQNRIKSFSPRMGHAVRSKIRLPTPILCGIFKSGKPRLAAPRRNATATFFEIARATFAPLVTL